MAERASYRCTMNFPVLASAFLTLMLLHPACIAAQEPPKNTRHLPDIISGPSLNQLPNFPMGYDIIQGNPPDSHIGRWIRYVILGPRNHPFPIVFFSPQEFKPKTGLEMLIVLPDSEYKALSAFSRAQRCANQEQPQNYERWYAGDITQYSAGKTTSCVLLPSDACSYLSGITALAEIRWTPKQFKLIYGIAMETCKASSSG